MYALISVSDKSGIVDFAQGLEKLGFKIISTGGTYKVLKKHNVDVVTVESITKFPEILDGRVKTLQPQILGGILAIKNNPEHLKICERYKIPLIDLLVVNLYPFEKTIANKNVDLDEAIENIDIGGPSMIRAGAKNYNSVAVITNPDRYNDVLQELKKNKGKITPKTLKIFAVEAFQHTARYDAIISDYLEKKFITKKEIDFPNIITPVYKKVSDLRYGENPHQKAAFYKLSASRGIPNAKQLHGKELSYNNIIDLEVAWSIVKEMDIPCASVIKHNNPCGTGIGDDIYSAYKKAYAGDPVSAFGSIVGLNRHVDFNTAKEITSTFVEAIIAPDYDDDALKLLKSKQNLRILKFDNFFQDAPKFQFRFIKGGTLVQSVNDTIITKKDLKIITKKQPNQKEINDMLFAYRIIKYVKSNAILIAKDGQTLGIGAGQMSRVDAVKIALEKAGDKAKGAVVASDAFFPFRDSIDLLAKHKISAVIQPGGSKRDQESIDAANEHGLSMVFSGIRFFNH